MQFLIIFESAIEINYITQIIKEYISSENESEKNVREIEKSMINFNKQKQSMPTSFIKNRCKRIKLDGEDYGILLCTNSNKLIYKPLINIANAETFECSLDNVKAVLKYRKYHKLKCLSIFSYNCK